MPARDAFHQAVRNALQKQAWLITDDPFFIEFAQVEMYTELRHNLTFCTRVKMLLCAAAEYTLI